jgi:aromatic-amino-acid transaminase
VVEVCQERSRGLPFLDMAYQGFADGIEPDAVAVVPFAASGLQFFVSSSFSKSFSLYGERVGALSIVTADKDEAARVLSQVKRVIRTNYSNPPTHGGAIVAAVLASPELRAMWEAELAGMRDRIRAMRTGLVDKLAAASPAGLLVRGAPARHVLVHRPHRRPGRAPEATSSASTPSAPAASAWPR